MNLRNLSPAAPMPILPPRYMNVAQLAPYIGRTENAVRHLVKSAAIPHIKKGRRVQFDREAIERWMARDRRGA